MRLALFLAAGLLSTLMASSASADLRIESTGHVKVGTTASPSNFTVSGQTILTTLQVTGDPLEPFVANTAGEINTPGGLLMGPATCPNNGVMVGAGLGVTTTGNGRFISLQIVCAPTR